MRSRVLCAWVFGVAVGVGACSPGVPAAAPGSTDGSGLEPLFRLGAGIRHAHLSSTACAAPGRLTDLSTVEEDIRRLGAATGTGAGDPRWTRLGDRGDQSATDAAFAEAAKFLREVPATAGLDAVKEGRSARAGSESTTIAGARNADAVVEIAETNHPDMITVQG